MDITIYISDRLNAQQKYFSTKSQVNKRYYYLIKTFIIFISVSIPFLLNFFKDVDSVKVIIGLLTVILALFNSLEIIFKFHEKWISYRAMAELLKQEQYLYQYGSGPYQSENNRDTLLVQRVEGYLAKESSSWVQQLSQKEQTQHP